MTLNYSYHDRNANIQHILNKKLFTNGCNCVFNNDLIHSLCWMDCIPKNIFGRIFAYVHIFACLSIFIGTSSTTSFRSFKETYKLNFLYKKIILMRSLLLCSLITNWILKFMYETIRSIFSPNFLGVLMASWMVE